jgi:hypothetical protein
MQLKQPGRSILGELTASSPTRPGVRTVRMRGVEVWSRYRSGLEPGLLLHAEPCPSHGFDRRRGTAHLDMCRALPTEEVEQQLAGRSGDPGTRFPAPCSNGLSGPRPLKLKFCAAQPPREKPWRATDVAPKGLV